MRAHARVRRGLISILAASAATLGVLTMPSYAATPPPALRTPATGSTVASNTPTFSWTRVSGARNYEIWVDDDPAFGSAVKRSTTNTRWVPDSPLTSTAQYWQVRATGADGSVSAWAASQVTIGRSAGPTLLSPADDPNGLHVLAQPNDPPVLSWQPIPGAVSYAVEVDDDDLFVDGVRTYTTRSTSTVVPDQRADGRYYWRVTANFGAGIVSLPSQKWTYRISPLPEVQNAVETGTQEDVVLDWDPVPGAKSYDLWVSTSPDDYNANTSATVLPSTTNVVGTRYSPPVTFLNNDTYYWKVRARNADGEAKVWDNVETHTFGRRWPDKPTLQWPPNSMTPVGDDAMYYQWTPVKHASYYELQVGIDVNFTPGTYATCRTAQTTFTPLTLLPDRGCSPTSQGQTYYWRVRAIDGMKDVLGIYDSTSNYHRFVYASSAATPTSPADGTTVEVPVLRWQSAPGAESYRVTIRDASSAKVIDNDQTYGLSYVPRVRLDPAKGPFTWSVVAAFPSDVTKTLVSAGGSFNVSTSVSPATVPALTPTAGSEGTPGYAPTTRPPALQWAPMSGAAYYRILLGDHGSSFWYARPGDDALISETFAYPAASSSRTHFLQSGSYDWMVEAYNASNVRIGISSAPGTFTISDLAPVAARRIALTGDALRNALGCSAPPGTCEDVPGTPVLKWAPVADASSYKIFVSQDPDITNYTFGTNTSNVPQTISTLWTPSMSASPAQLPDSTAGKAYYWYILPCKTAGFCNPDPTSQTDQVAYPKQTFTKHSPRVGLLGPTPYAENLDGTPQTVEANDVTFSWSDYLDSNTASAFAPTGETGRQTARNYRIQVATQSAGFESNIIDDKTVDQVTYTPFDRTYPEGNLYWRVQALDQAGNGLAWSEIRRFFKQSPRPTLTAPTGTVAGTTPFRWTPTAFAASYRLQVVKNNDATFSPANIVIDKTVKQTAYAWDQPLAPSAQSYRWRVQRLDAQGKPGQYTAGGAFVVGSQIPAPTSPSAGATLAGDNLYFTWSALLGAAAYEIEYGLSGAAGTTKTRTTALAFAPLVTAVAGSYRWRVNALDASNNTLGSSSWRTLTVAGATKPPTTGTTTTNARPKVVAVSPAIGRRVTGRPTFKITFSEPVTGISRRSIKLTLNGRAVRAQVAVVSSKVATLRPARTLKRRTTYTMVLTSAIRDRSNATLAATSWKVRSR